MRQAEVSYRTLQWQWRRGGANAPKRAGGNDRQMPKNIQARLTSAGQAIFPGTKFSCTLSKHNYIVVSMIPDLIDLGSLCPWAVLPPGIHDATLGEVEARFATTPHRQWLFGGFVRVAEALAFAGCRHGIGRA